MNCGKTVKTPVKGHTGQSESSLFAHVAVNMHFCERQLKGTIDKACISCDRNAYKYLIISEWNYLSIKIALSFHLTP